MMKSRLQIAGALWGKNVLITGASGFVGSAILREGFFLNDVLNANIRFTLVVRGQNEKLFNLTRNRKDVRFIESSIGTPFEIKDSFDIVFHCATPASAVLNNEAPIEMFNTNVRGMSWILEALKQQDSLCKLVFTSSGAIYGPQPEDMSHIPEGFLGGPDPTSLNSAYAEGKRVAEFLLSQAGLRNEVFPVIARLFAFSGVGLPLDKHFAIGNFVLDGLRQDTITVRGTGLDIRSYLDATDMAVWLWAASCHQPDFPLHIGSEHAISIASLASLVAERFKNVLGKELSIEKLNNSSLIDGASVYVPSTSRTRKLLKVDEFTRLETSIDQMIINSGLC